MLAKLNAPKLLLPVVGDAWSSFYQLDLSGISKLPSYLTMTTKAVSLPSGGQSVLDPCLNDRALSDLTPGSHLSKGETPSMVQLAAGALHVCNEHWMS